MYDASSARDAEAIDISSTDHTVSLARCAIGLYVGGAGDVIVQMDGLGDPSSAGNTVTFTAVPAGTILPIKFRKVIKTSTTASSMLALFR